MQMSRSLIRVFIGGFLIYIGFDLALDVYNDGGHPGFYAASALFMIIGAFISYYYYKCHKKEMLEEDGEAVEDEQVEQKERVTDNSKITEAFPKSIHYTNPEYEAEMDDDINDDKNIKK